MGVEEDDVNMIDDENSGGDNNPSADQERRIRREIANSNERRRMQSINAGFQSLRTLLPHHEGEKLSKAAILQQTAEYIYSLEQEKTRLLQQNSQLKRLLALNQQRLDGDETSPQLKKKRIHNENDNLRTTEEESLMSSKVNDLNVQLIQEQRIRLQLEETVRSLEAQIAACSTPTTIIQGQTIIKQEEDSCRLLVSQDLSTRPPAAILLSAVTEPVPLKPDPSSMRVSVEKIPNLTGPLPQPVVVAPVPTLKKSSPPITLAKAPPIPTPPPSTIVERPLPQELTDSSKTNRSYILSTSSRHNLDSIVEAIRHLEGDHLFSEEQQQGVIEEVAEYSTSHTKIAINSFPIPESSSSGIFIMNKN